MKALLSSTVSNTMLKASMKTSVVSLPSRANLRVISAAGITSRPFLTAGRFGRGLTSKAVAITDIISEKVVDLSAATPDGEHWGNIDRWIVFSDLHVSEKTAQDCKEVLYKVRAEAEARNAGIIFLGDFWHIRGVIPVIPFNTVLSELRHWKQPTLMLVGNHDQVSLGGLDHSLTAFAACCPSMHIIDRPSVFLDALFLPYRKSNSELKAAIKAAGSVKAIFAHADVLGAFVNEQYQAREGLEADAFGERVTYLGHYHKPQLVSDTSVRYVGSPYQVSRSESGQQKALLVLDKEWKVVEEVVLDTGPRHFNVTNELEIKSLPLRAGDRLRWNMKDKEGPENLNLIVEALQDKGIKIELVAATMSSFPRIEAVENLGPLPLLHTYASSVGMSSEAIDRGHQILEEIGLTKGVEARTRSANIKFESLELEGYGPFRDRIDYSLGDRGLRVISGRNVDDSGADSNGTGKSSLVMATLWCLTGKSDARTMTAKSSSLTGSEIVNENCSKARVKVAGSVNGKPFSVERIVHKKKGLASLSFFHDGEDVTKADSRLTQEAMEELLACSLLTRVVFHTQTDIAGLLEAEDKEFKGELSQIAEMSIWEDALEAVRDLTSHAKQRLRDLESELKSGQQRLFGYKAKAAQAEEEVRQWEEKREQQVFLAEDDMRHSKADLQLQIKAADAGLAAFIKDLTRFEGGLQETPVIKDPALESPQEPEEVDAWDSAAEAAALEALNAEVRHVEDEFITQQAMTARTEALLQASKQQLEEYAGLQHSHEPSEASAMVCDRCLQAIDSAIFQKNKSRLEEAFRQASGASRQEQQMLDSKKAELADKRKQSTDATLCLNKKVLDRRDEKQEREIAARLALRERKERENELKKARQRVLTQYLKAKEFSEKLQSLQQPVQHALQPSQKPSRTSRQKRKQTAEDLEETIRELQTLFDVAGDSVRDFLSSEKTLKQIQQGTNPHHGSAAMLRDLILEDNRNMSSSQTKYDSSAREVAMLKELEVAFGRGGIQSFALEGVLGELQERTAKFMERLSSEISLTLSASRPAKTPKGKEAASVEKITKGVLFRLGAGSGEVVQRTVKQLSGGERRRVALALALGFADLVSARTGLRCNLLVLDEVLQQLDEEGCSRVSNLLKSLPQRNILVVGQANSYVMQVFDRVDTVVKQKGAASLDIT